MRLRLVLLLVGCTVLAFPGLAAAEGGCPNEALRVELGSGALPDCRAYEMVTPTFKNSWEAYGLQAISSDGSHVLTLMQGAFAGTQSSPGTLEMYYVLARTPSGWVPSAVNPPAPLFPAQGFFGASLDLSRTLWMTRPASRPILARDIYVREADGSLVEVGPAVAGTGPPAGGPYQSFFTLAGRAWSNDASHLLFTITNAEVAGGGLWPGDTTVGASTSSLYEYVGTGHTRPELVGVDGEGHLLGDCGVEPGARGSQDTYNEMSGDGETVFFTVRGSGCGAPAPPVDEVYARIGQFPIDTVAVSEPAYSDCTRCQTGVEGFGHPAVPLAAAVFQGASADGSKAFFLTEQELFAGDTGMNLYEYDFDNPAGQKVVRVSQGASEPQVKGVARVSDDGSHVYFVAGGLLSGANAEGAAPVPGGDNLYVFERDAENPGGRVAFIGTLSDEDSQDWQEKDERPVQATPDGRFLVFQSVADLTPGDTSSQQQVFEYDALTESLVRVSVAAAGYASGAESADTIGSSIPVGEFFANFGGPALGRPGVAVSEDGSVVLFASAAALVPGAVQAAANGAASVYEYRSTGSIADGAVHLLSSGRDRASAAVGGLSESGDDAFFVTAESLLVQDLDTSRDIYDARAGGGFPAPVVTGSCEGEACQSAPSSAPVIAGPGSVSGAAGGNLTPSAPEPVGHAKPKPKATALTRAQKLAAAVRACRRESRRRRVGCEARAHRRFGVSTGRGKGR